MVDILRVFSREKANLCCSVANVISPLVSFGDTIWLSDEGRLFKAAARRALKAKGAVWGIKPKVEADSKRVSSAMPSTTYTNIQIYFRNLPNI